MQQKALILPCGGNCDGNADVGLLTWIATQELVLEAKGEWVYYSRINSFQSHANAPKDSQPFIVVDGCDEQCGKKFMEARNCKFEFHLILSDLGILDDSNTEIGEEDLQLAKDAIVAESTRISEQPPKILGGCGCR